MMTKYLKKDMYLQRKQKIIDDRSLINSIIMKYQKIINFLDNTPNQPSKFRTKNWVEINDDSVESITPIVKLNLKLHC